MHGWSQIHDPFDLSILTLRSISTGVECQQQDEVTNCDLIFAALFNQVKIGKKTETHFNPITLFYGLTAMAEREEDMSKFIEYKNTVCQKHSLKME